MEISIIDITAGIYRLDPIHSTVGFAVKHKVSKFRGTFGTFDGTLTVDDDGTLQLTGSAGIASIEVKHDDMAAHLQSPAFFDAERHPDATFSSEPFRVSADGTVSLTGQLTMRGHSETVTASGNLSYMADDGHGHQRVGLDLSTVVDRDDFGISHIQAMPDGSVNVENAVTISAELELSRQ